MRVTVSGFAPGMLEGARKGNLNFAQILGYDRVDDHLEINEKEAEIVRTIFRMYTEQGKGFRRIAQELNELGYRSKNGRKLSIYLSNYCCSKRC